MLYKVAAVRFCSVLLAADGIPSFTQQFSRGMTWIRQGSLMLSEAWYATISGHLWVGHVHHPLHTVWPPSFPSSGWYGGSAGEGGKAQC